MPKQKGITNTTLGGMSNLYRAIVPFANPQQMLDGNVWRNISRSQPVIMDCITTLIMYVQGLPYDIRAKDSEKQDELKDKIVQYKEILKNSQQGAGFSSFLELLLQDFYMTPFGGGVEAIRYSDDELYSFKSLDAATLFPYNDEKTPVFQYVPEVSPNYVFFTKKQLYRMVQMPRPEIIKYGWQYSPPEKIYLALELLNRGDKYYANLLLDTPEAGLLDLGDMSRESAEKWLESFRNLFTGIDAFKIPVLFEHTVQAKWIPFTRPPNEIIYDAITMKYAQLCCAAFGLTIGDIGLKFSNGSLSSDIRDERHSKTTGKAYVKNKVTELINNILPEDLIFWFVDTDDEVLVAKGRARSANAVAGRNLIESGAITPNEWRQQLRADGLLTIPLPEVPDASEFDILKEIDGTNDQLALQEEQLKLQKQQIASQPKNTGSGNNSKFQRKGGQAGFGLNKRRNVRGGKLESIQGKEPVAPSSGGQGEIKSIAIETDTGEFVEKTKLKSVISKSFDEIINKVNATRVRRLVKLALPKLESINKSILENENYEDWNQNFNLELFDMVSKFEEPQVVRGAIENLVKDIDKSYEKDKWWLITLDDTEIGDILTKSYENGLADSALNIQDALYENGYIDNLEFKSEINLKNDKILNSIYARAVTLNELINKGTEYYITRLIISTINDELIKLRKKDDFDYDKVVKSENFIDLVSNSFYDQFVEILNERSKQITDYEEERMYNLGYLKQMKEVGFKTKNIVHNGSDEPCEVCRTNINLGDVEIDYLYENKFGEQSDIPQFHNSCHCSISWNEDELKVINNNYYLGE